MNIWNFKPEIMKEITEEQIREVAVGILANIGCQSTIDQVKPFIEDPNAVLKLSYCLESVITMGKWAIEQLQPEWIPITCIEDLPTKNGNYFVCVKTKYPPYYQVNPFSGRLSNAIHHITGKPVFSHYMVFEPEPPKQ